MLSIGLMSGTSMDGIDAALLKTDGSTFIEELGNTSIAYDLSFKLLLKAAEYAIRRCAGDMAQASADYTQAINDYLITELRLKKDGIKFKINELNDYLHGKNKSMTLEGIIQHSADLHAMVVKKLLHKTGYVAHQIDVVGYHGQTMLHRPSMKISIILGHGQYLANQLGITVVNDFRCQDIDSGGQGAPFAPLYHYALAVRDKRIPVAVVNCGGIANMTLIHTMNELDLIAFDTGPGNGLIDQLIRQRTQGKEMMDTDGRYGKQGKINTAILKILYEKAILKENQNYFSLIPPKSLDIGDMVLIPELDLLSLEDACATLEAFTADTLVHSIELLNTPCPMQWILTGGGWNNPVICRELKNRLTKKCGDHVKILTADDVGWNSQAMEAQTFAYHAVRSLQNKPLSLPNTTRVPKPLSGGHTYIPVKKL